MMLPPMCETISRSLVDKCTAKTGDVDVCGRGKALSRRWVKIYNASNTANFSHPVTAAMLGKPMTAAR